MESMGVAEGAKITTSSGLCGRAGGSRFAADMLHCPKRTLRSFVRSFRKSLPPSHSFRARSLNKTSGFTVVILWKRMCGTELGKISGTIGESVALSAGGSSCSAVHTSYTRSSALCTDPLLLGSLGLACCRT